LAYALVLTSRIRLGTVSLMLRFARAMLAKQLARLDVLSGGRLGVGVSLAGRRRARRCRDAFRPGECPIRGVRAAGIASWTSIPMDTEVVTPAPAEAAVRQAIDFLATVLGTRS
jgi:hypothetical protein